MLELLSSARDLLLVVIGFGLVIVIHEMGHFLAARWAGVRVDQFAVGFGSAVCSYRKGLGWRRGSTRKEYEALPPERRAENGGDVGATEYRLNWFPLGGYVKMLGQDDLHVSPLAVAQRPDSYLAAPVHKRMVIISAGVIMNLILAAVLFIFVFMVGLRVESSVVGEVLPGSAAASATPLDASHATGLEPGDRIASINGKEIRSFNDLALAVAMARKGAPMAIRVERDGRMVEFTAEPKVTAATSLQDLGVIPAASGQVLGAAGATPEALARARQILDESGLKGVEPGATLIAINGAPASTAHELERAVLRAAGAPVRATFRQPSPDSAASTGEAKTIETTIVARPALQTARVAIGEGAAATAWPIAHLLGIGSPMRVEAVAAQGLQSGLQAGDVIARVDTLDWPDTASAIAVIRAHARKPVDIVVLRDGARVALRPTVGPGGTIGFSAASATSGAGLRAAPTDAPMGVRTSGPVLRRHPSLAAPRAPVATVATTPREPVAKAPASSESAAASPESEVARASLAAGAALAIPPGTVILAVNGTEVSSFEHLREALGVATADAASTGGGAGAGGGAEVTLRIALPIESAEGSPPEETLVWSLSPEAVGALHTLGWRSPVDQGFFEIARTTLRAKGPLSAVAMGVRETNRVMMTTYLTFRRLVEGSVKVEHLKGPVGIAHLGTMVASQGTLHLLFFLALISVNLAVVNFLPFPIVDGGQFVFLLVEAITRRPVSAAIQSAAIMAGVVVIGAVFLVVTFNDVTSLLGR